MPKFSVGDAVEKVPGESGVVVEIFTTNDGEPRYAVEHEGAIQFVLETQLVNQKVHH